MKKLSIFIAMLLLFSFAIFAQVGVNDDNSSPDSSAMLDVKSNSKGFLVPRMTAAQRDSIVNPSPGLMIYCNDNDRFYFNNGRSIVPNWLVLNTQWLTPKNSGSDVSIHPQEHTSSIKIQGLRCYEILNSKGLLEDGILEIRFEEADVQLYAADFA